MNSVGRSPSAIPRPRRTAEATSSKLVARPLQQRLAARLGLLRALFYAADRFGRLSETIQGRSKVPIRARRAFAPTRFRGFAAVKQCKPTNLVKMIELLDILVHVLPPTIRFQGQQCNPDRIGAEAI